ncbi:hypothetical protein [Actinacidiphila sp. bgisy160]|uniref:hypothetical protein n=1 Tax=Actinacidiphila sp. bgisy160 TaxID=3413796 RepID=UPI003D733DAA
MEEALLPLYLADAERIELARTIAEALVRPAEDEIRALRTELTELQRNTAGQADLMARARAVLERVAAHIRLDSREWDANRNDAWLYGALVGWSEDGRPVGMDDDPMMLEAVGARHRWSLARIQNLRFCAAVVRQIRGENDPPAAPARQVVPTAPAPGSPPDGLTAVLEATHVHGPVRMPAFSFAKGF